VEVIFWIYGALEEDAERASGTRESNEHAVDGRVDGIFEKLSNEFSGALE
jgi:hypothetical protein